MKAIWRIVFGLLLLAAPIARGQFTYTTNNGTITITSYTGPSGAVTIPSSITGLPVNSIAAYVFPNENPTSVIIPGSVSSIAGYAFAYCNSLKSVYFRGVEPFGPENTAFNEGMSSVWPGLGPTIPLKTSRKRCSAYFGHSA